MVENQLRPSRIVHPGVLAAMSKIPREQFLPARLRGVAYQDEDIDMGEKLFLIEPLALAKLLQAVDPDQRAAALVIGCPTGYCTAVLAQLVGTAFHLSPTESLGNKASKNLEAVNCDNVIVKIGDAASGLGEQAPFGVILLCGSVMSVPPALLGQLEDGGRAAAVVRSGQSGSVVLAERIGDSVGMRRLADAAIPPLRELEQKELFQF